MRNTVADLTSANANVFYELGVRHAVKPATTVLLFAAEGARLPFDVAMRPMPYRLGPDGKPAPAARLRQAGLLGLGNAARGRGPREGRERSHGRARQGGGRPSRALGARNDRPQPAAHPHGARSANEAPPWASEIESELKKWRSRNPLKLGLRSLELRPTSGPISARGHCLCRRLSPRSQFAFACIALSRLAKNVPSR